MKGLSYDWTAMNTRSTAYTRTATPTKAIGLVWGWQSLVGGGPLTMPAKTPNYTYNEVIILLTDGLNTQNRWSTTQSTIDKRMYDSATTARAPARTSRPPGSSSTRIQVNTGGDPTSTLLQNCASSSDKFFLLTTANQIVTTFQAIGTNLSKLRVAK